MLGRSDKKNAIRFGGTMTPYLGVMAALAFFVLLLFVLPSVAQAQPDLGLEFAAETGLTTTDIRTTISRIINAFLGLLGIIAVLIILYAGFIWMTAGGSEEKITKAKKLLINGFIGLAIIMSSYAIVSFLFRAILDTGNGLGGRSTASPLTSLYGGGRGTGALGSGIIDYHYPEAGQVDVPRNTKISITLKKPLVLSTIIREYYDNDTYTTADDYLCKTNVPAPDADAQALSDGDCVPVDENTILQLQTMNFKIIPNVNLGTPTGGDVHAQFDERYPDQDQDTTIIMSTTPTVKVTLVKADEVDPLEGQTLIITLGEYLGSPLEDMNYRVAIRGGVTGVKVWSIDNETNEEFMDDAFDDMAVDGSYFWGFTVGTELDLTPPKVKVNGIEPGSKYWDPKEKIYLNQILQVYFDEAIDPTSASGTTGTGIGAGFIKLFVQVKCPTAPTVDIPSPCGLVDSIPLGTAWKTLSGEVLLTNRYRTAEFTPSTPCDTVSENSCGEKVFCLPKHADLRVIVRAADVDPNAPDDVDKPPAASAENGVTDMVGNSFDGNMNGMAEGPGDLSPFKGYLVNLYRLLKPTEQDLKNMSDDLVVEFKVGKEVDLIPPVVTDISPKSASATGDPALDAPFENDPNDDYPLPGPSKVPPEEPIVIEWSKVLRGSSLRTGPPTDKTATLIIKSRELRKRNTEICKDANCPTDPLAPIAFHYYADKKERADEGYTELSLIHRPFFTGNDLGYTSEEMEDPALDTLRPVYMPVLRWKIQDTRQNCFFPSEGYLCDSISDSGNTSCCDRTGQTPFSCDF